LNPLRLCSNAKTAPLIFFILYDYEVMMEQQGVDSHLTVAEVLDRWPQTAAVFNRYHTACLGCAMAPFCTIADIAAIYHVALSDLLRDLQAACADSER
jgi:hybrid cluster-associated redox disulfide protein